MLAAIADAPALPAAFALAVAEQTTSAVAGSSTPSKDSLPLQYFPLLALVAASA